MNKSLTLGVVAPLLLAGGQQLAAQPSACDLNLVSVAAIEATPGFACTVTNLFGTATFSNVSFSPFLTDPSHFVVGFEGEGGASFGVVLTGTAGVVFPGGNVPDLFNYKISISNISDSVLPPGLVSATLVFVASAMPPPATGAVTDTENFTGNVVGGNALGVTIVAPNVAGNSVSTLDGDTTITVTNSLSTAPLGSTIVGAGIANNFVGRLRHVSTPEPTSLSLFGVGLAGLALARRWRARPRSAPPT